MLSRSRQSKSHRQHRLLFFYSLLCIGFLFSCGGDSQERKTTSGSPATGGSSSGTVGGNGPSTGPAGETEGIPTSQGTTEGYDFTLGAVDTKWGTVNFVMSDGKLVLNFDRDWTSEEFTTYKIKLNTKDNVVFEKTSACSEDTDEVKSSALYFTEVSSVVSATIETFSITSSSCL